MAVLCQLLLILLLDFFGICKLGLFFSGLPEAPDGAAE